MQFHSIAGQGQRRQCTPICSCSFIETSLVKECLCPESKSVRHKSSRFFSHKATKFRCTLLNFRPFLTPTPPPLDQSIASAKAIIQLWRIHHKTEAFLSGRTIYYDSRSTLQWLFYTRSLFHPRQLHHSLILHAPGTVLCICV